MVLALDRTQLGEEDDEDDEEEKIEKTSTLKRAFDKTYWLWVVIIVFGTVVQCLRSATMSPERKHFIGIRAPVHDLY